VTSVYGSGSWTRYRGKRMHEVLVNVILIEVVVMLGLIIIGAVAKALSEK